MTLLTRLTLLARLLWLCALLLLLLARFALLPPLVSSLRLLAGLLLARPISRLLFAARLLFTLIPLLGASPLLSSRLRTLPLPLARAFARLVTRLTCFAASLVARSGFGTRVAGALVLRLTRPFIRGLILPGAASSLAVGLLATPVFSTAGSIATRLALGIALFLAMSGSGGLGVFRLVRRTSVGTFLSWVGVILRLGRTLGILLVSRP